MSETPLDKYRASSPPIEVSVVPQEHLGRIVVILPQQRSWHGDDGERRFITMTPQVAEDLMHALEGWKDER